MNLKDFDLKKQLKSQDLMFQWQSIVNESDSFKNHFNHELKREIQVGHELYGKDWIIIARGNGDNCLYQCVDDESVASVHLTYCKSTEILPYPLSAVFENLDDWYECEYIPNLPYPLNNSSELNQFEQIVIAYALGYVNNKDFEQYIYSLDENNLPFTGMDYFELISLNFNDKENVILFLNSWYERNKIESKDFDDWAIDLVEFYNLSLK